MLRELYLNIAQLSTARQELPWLHFPLGATLAFLAPLSPEVAFWRRPGAAALASFCVDTASLIPAQRSPASEHLS